MRGAILAVFCVAATVTAQLSPEQQARLEELLNSQDNAELATLLAVADKGVNAPGITVQDVAVSRRRKESGDIFDIEADLKGLQDDFDAAIGATVLTDVIATAVNDTLNSDSLVLGLIQEQTELKALLSAGLESSSSKHTAGLSKFGDDAVAAVAAAAQGVADEAEARKAGEAGLNKKFNDFEAAVSKKLEVVDGLSKTVGKQVDDALKPISGSIGILNRVKLTYQSNPKIPVFRWNWWHTHQHGSTSWFDSNNPRAFGGQHPSHWTDGNHRAWDMNKDLKYIKRFFIRHGNGDKWGATVCSETFLMYSSTTGRMCGVLFRIKNTRSSSVGWNPQWMYTSFGGWGEDASVSMNGQSNFRNHCNHNFCRNNVNMNIPGNSGKDRISTVIFVSSGCHNYHVGYNRWERANILMFNDNSLSLPDGLEYVDDLDTASGSWKN